MTHSEIKSALGDVVERAGGGWTGFARVLETLADIAQHSDDALMRQAYPGINTALCSVEDDPQFQTIDVTSPWQPPVVDETKFRELCGPNSEPCDREAA